MKIGYSGNLKIIGVAAMLALSISYASAANLVQNGNFGTGDLTDWTKVGNFSTGYNELRNTPIDGESTYPGSSYFLVLGNFPPGGGANSGLAGVLQTLTTVSGQTYDLSLAWTESQTNTPGQQLFEVLWDGVAVPGSVIDGDTGSSSWQILSFDVTGTGSDTLTLEGYSFNSYNGVDNVSVTAIAATPLPSTWTMLIAGFLGLGFLAYRGKKKGFAAIATA
jgi:hypothetical protein